MTNYDKKRKRQRGRQGGGESERQRIYREGFFAGQHQVIDRMVDSGILPRIDFELKEVYRSDEHKDEK
jgi:hypothetical protein